MSNCQWEEQQGKAIGNTYFVCKTCGLHSSGTHVGCSEDKTGKFSVGTSVDKRKGYKFPGEVRAVFTNSSGEIRYVVELKTLGLLHIFNEDQLMEQD